MHHSEPENVIRRHVIYSGLVQGVGFRMTTQAIAANFDVTGWVRNLPDGTVEMEAQSRLDELDRFLAAIAREFRGHIQDANTREVASVPDEPSFSIRV